MKQDEAPPCVMCGRPRRAVVPLTPRQLECAQVSDELTRAAGFAPSYDEIGRALGLASRSAVARLIGQLAKRGWLDRVPGTYRSLRLRCIPPPPHEPRRHQDHRRGLAALGGVTGR